jgi:hypothetical protein
MGRAQDAHEPPRKRCLAAPLAGSERVRHCSQRTNLPSGFCRRTRLGEYRIRMLHLIRHQIVAPSWHRCASSTAESCWSALLCSLVLALPCKVHAQEVPATGKKADAAPAIECLPAGNGFLRARLTGALATELDWGNKGTECTGAVRPTDGGIRMRFTAATAAGEKLVLVFGIATLREGKSGKAVPVNVTIIREGAGEFYGTQGDDKCMLDEVSQKALVGIPHRTRSYRVVARGFCTEPARAIRGKGAVLMSRFDFAGRVDFDTEDKISNEPMVAKQ